MTEAVVDNTLLSNFAHIQQPKLLATAFDQPVTVPAVMDELEVGVQIARIPSVDWSWLPIIELTDDERMMAERLKSNPGTMRSGRLRVSRCPTICKPECRS